MPKKYTWDVVHIDDMGSGYSIVAISLDGIEVDSGVLSWGASAPDLANKLIIKHRGK